MVRGVVRAGDTPLANVRLTCALRSAQRALKSRSVASSRGRAGSSSTRDFTDVTIRWPVEDGAATLVYADDVLERERSRAGFHDVTRCELSQSDQADLDSIDQSREGGSQVAVEAVR